MTSSVIVPPDEVGGLPNISRGSVTIQLLRSHTAFVGLKEFIPEDILWRHDHPRVPSLICLQEQHTCECPWGCVAKLAARCYWLFEKLDSLQQVFLLFNRGEKNLRRRVPPKDVNNDLTAEERAAFRTELPRLHALLVERDFYQAMTPYRLFRVNYDSLDTLLDQSCEKRLETPLSFWSGSF